MEQEKCKNGSSCKWFKENRCLFGHNDQPWKTVKPRRQKQIFRNNQPRQQQQGRQQQHGRQQQQVRQQNPQIKKGKEDCTNGPACKFMKETRCHFKHKQNKHQTQQHHQPSNAQHQSGGLKQLKQCKFGRSCDKGRDCGFLHLPKDFLPLQSGRRN